MKLKTLLLAACLAAATPAAVRAQNAAVDRDALTFLAATYLDCGTYYHVVSTCMGAQQKKYTEMGDTLWQRALDAAAILKISESLPPKITATKRDMDKKTGGDCAKVGVLHKTYKALCKNAYDGK